MARAESVTPQPKIYFARAIDGEDPVEIRALAAQVACELSEAGFAMVDPTIGAPVLGEQQAASTSNSWAAIVDHELSLLRRCDAVLMDMSIPNRNYIGCVCEMTYAYLWRIPCVVYPREPGQPRPWLIYHVDAVFETRRAAIGYLAKTLGQARWH